MLPKKGAVSAGHAFNQSIYILYIYKELYNMYIYNYMICIYIYISIHSIMSHLYWLKINRLQQSTQLSFMRTNLIDSARTSLVQNCAKTSGWQVPKACFGNTFFSDLGSIQLKSFTSYKWL